MDAARDTTGELPLIIPLERPYGVVLNAPHNRLVRALLEEHRNALVCVLAPGINGAAFRARRSTFSCVHQLRSPHRVSFDILAFFLLNPTTDLSTPLAFT